MGIATADNARRIGADVRGLDANLDTMTKHTTEATEANLAVTMTHTQEGPAGRTGVRMGNTEANHKGRLTRSQSGQVGMMRYPPERGKHAGKVWSRANWKMFRNYFVSRAASSGMSFVHVMEATGHDSYEMVRHYFRLNEDAFRQDFKKFDSGLSGVDVSWPP